MDSDTKVLALLALALIGFTITVIGIESADERACLAAIAQVDVTATEKALLINACRN